MDFALNQVTLAPRPFLEFLDIAAELGCVGVEPRNDLGRPLFDGLSPREAGAQATRRGLRFLSLNQVWPFDRWSPERARELERLIAQAQAAGAEGVSLIPDIESPMQTRSERVAHLTRALERTLPSLERAGLVGFVEALGFPRASIRAPDEVEQAIRSLGAGGRLRLVHDTFQHRVSGLGGPIAACTGLVQASSVTSTQGTLSAELDPHRGLIGEDDAVDNAGQLRTLWEQGYRGPVCFECTDAGVQSLPDPVRAIGESMERLRGCV